MSDAAPAAALVCPIWYFTEPSAALLDHVHERLDGIEARERAVDEFADWLTGVRADLGLAPGEALPQRPRLPVDLTGGAPDRVEPAPTDEEMEAARHILTQMPPDILADLQAAIRNSETCEAFVNSIFVGDCPACNSSKTGDCENDPEIEELLVGRCYDCGTLWCT